jgi:MraZ protein
VKSANEATIIVEGTTMGECVFYGEYELRLDTHNRLTIPADIRWQLDPAVHDAFICRVGPNQTLQLYLEHRFEQLMDAHSDPGYELRQFSLASRSELDAKGRILLPEAFVRDVGLDRDVTLIGARDHLEIWDRAAWAVRREHLLSSKLPPIKP